MKMPSPQKINKFMGGVNIIGTSDLKYGYFPYDYANDKGKFKYKILQISHKKFRRPRSQIDLNYNVYNVNQLKRQQAFMLNKKNIKEKSSYMKD